MEIEETKVFTELESDREILDAIQDIVQFPEIDDAEWLLEQIKKTLIYH